MNNLLPELIQLILDKLNLKKLLNIGNLSTLFNKEFKNNIISRYRKEHQYFEHLDDSDIELIFYHYKIRHNNNIDIYNLNYTNAINYMKSLTNEWKDLIEFMKYVIDPRSDNNKIMCLHSANNGGVTTFFSMYKTMIDINFHICRSIEYILSLDIYSDNISSITTNKYEYRKKKIHIIYTDTYDIELTDNLYNNIKEDNYIIIFTRGFNINTNSITIPNGYEDKTISVLFPNSFLQNFANNLINRTYIETVKNNYTNELKCLVIPTL